MSDYLSGSSGTGNKILGNINHFHHTYNGIEKSSGDSCRHKFDWTFKEQEGYISIVLTPEGRIIYSRSLMACTKNQHEFKNTLYLNNDLSLKNVFLHMLSSENIEFENFNPFKP